jgi:hypothetical protein
VPEPIAVVLDNLILDLVVDVDALILVTDDTDLTELNPWNGRLLIRPRTFVERAVRSRQARAASGASTQSSSAPLMHVPGRLERD